jgi:hypothetical protein
MGGRISGNSPREEKIAVRNGRSRPVRPYHTKVSGDTVTATAARQASKQQLGV